METRSSLSSVSSSVLGSALSNTHESLYRHHINVNKKHAHCAMFIKQQFEEEEKYMMYMYPDIISANIHAKGMEQLKGVLHAARAGSLDTLGGELAFVHLAPSNAPRVESVSSPSSITSPSSPTQPPKKPTLERITDLKLEMEKRENIICTFEDCGELLFILMLPVEFTEMIHMDLVSELKSLLVFIFPSIESVVMDADQHYKLNFIFNRFFRIIFKPEMRIRSFLSSFVNGFTILGTSSEVYQTLSDELSSIEGMQVTANMSGSHQYAIVGSCIFHKGTLVTSHLSPELTKNVVRYLTFMKLVNRKADLEDLVIIERVYIKKKPNAFQLYEKPTTAAVPHTLIILSQKSELLCVLLDSQHYFDQDHVIDRMKDSLERLRYSGVWSLAEENVMDLSIDKRDDVEMQVRSLTSLTDGNVLLHYLAHTNLDGVILLPTALAPRTGGLKAIENRFVRIVEIIREVLLTKRHEERSSTVVEYGIHVEDNESLDKPIGYWVVGRLIPDGEFYVCYEDSVPQNAVEMAHRLASRHCN